MKTLQRTLTIIKPDAVKKNAIGDIIEQFEKNGFRILAIKMLEISQHQAEQFYAVHATRPFYHSLTPFMPLVPITMLQGRKVDQKRKIAQRITDAMVEEAGARREAIVVTFLEVSKESYASGGELMADKQRK